MSWLPAARYQTKLGALQGVYLGLVLQWMEYSAGTLGQGCMNPGNFWHFHFTKVLISHVLRCILQTHWKGKLKSTKRRYTWCIIHIQLFFFHYIFTECSITETCFSHHSTLNKHILVFIEPKGAFLKIEITWWGGIHQGSLQ